MRRRTFEEALPDECLAQKQLDVLFCPSLRGEALKKHHDLLEVHIEELVGPLHKKGRTHVQMELREALLFSLVDWLVSKSLCLLGVDRPDKCPTFGLCS